MEELYKYGKVIILIVGILIFILIGPPIFRLIYFVLFQIIHEKITNRKRKTQNHFSQDLTNINNEYPQILPENQSKNYPQMLPENQNKKYYIVKGRIKEINQSTNHKKIRYGSPHFLPLEEVCIYNEPRNREYVFGKNSLSVRGKHRSGMFKAKRTNIRFLENLHLHEIINPSVKTLDFIQKNNILYFEEGTEIHSHVIDILDHISKQEYPIIEKAEISDEQYLKAQEFVFQLQQLFSSEEYEKIIRDFIVFPLLNHRWEKGKKVRERIDAEYLRNNFNQIFTKDTKVQIKQTDIKTIYPSENVMILGSLRIEISRNNEFKINTIESLSRLET